MAKSPDVPDLYKDVPGVFSHMLKGRLMWFKPVGGGQLMLLQRFRAQLQMLKQKNDDSAYLKLAFDVSVKTLNVIDSLFLDPQDREYVEQLMLSGELDTSDLMPILTGITQGTPDDDAEVEAVPKNARVKKAATGVKKTTANGRRTKL